MQHFLRSPLRPARGLLTALSVLLLAAALAPSCAPGSKVGEGVSVVEEENQGNGGTGGSGGGDDEPPMGLTPADQDLYDDPPAPECGDFELNDGEVCDDGNNDNLDGCSGNCLVIEPGYECIEAGTPCVRAQVCGDGVIVTGEACDDGNADPSDGCSSNCQIEAGYTCSEPGSPCESFVICGDGFVVLTETCDDGNLTAGDGCSDACELEAGYECLIANAKCRPECGDGQLIANERCDDGDTTPGDGCDENCRLEPGFVCPTPGAACIATDCGDGDPEGSEQCDDGNALPFDGCTPECTNEPVCGFAGGDYLCPAVCGDGMLFEGEEACDDGNNDADDGCSPTCTFELGYECTDAAAPLGDELELPVIIRDFSAGHPHFEVDPLGDQRLPGIVQNQLGNNGKPVYNPAYTLAVQNRPWTMDGPAGAANGAATLTTPQAIAQRFAQWYTDVPGQNFTFLRTLNLALQGDGSFQFAASGAAGQFFPIGNAEGFGAEGNPTNFHFTSEVRQWFLSRGGELLSFSGDDDVWVFVNGQLTVDLGGIHSEIQGSITLGEVGEPSVLCVQQVPTNPALTCTNINVPISPNVNEIVVFQAERHVTLSNYTLTLRGFNAPVTSCQSDCGDGVVTPDETCDEGDANGPGYEQCTDDCVPGPRCGDGNVDAGEEECDNGINRDVYATSEGACAPGCVLPSSCGDGVVDAAFGEQCDNAENNDGSYDGCTAACELGPRCGDGVEDDGEEQCDDGNRRNGDGCNVNCAIERDPK